MKKLLLTGCGSLHTGAKLQVEYAIPSDVIMATAQEAGWEVERRSVLPGENLDHYDKVIVYLMTPNAFPARFVLGALWALGTRKDAIIAVDDWQTRACVNGYRNALGRGLIWRPILQSVRRGWEESLIPENKKVIEEACEELNQRTLNRSAIWHAYVGGDPLKLPFWRVNDIFTYDPTNFYRGRYIEQLGPTIAPESRDRTWVLASLLQKTDWLEKQALTWPVDAYGNRKLKQPRVSEVELLRVYQQRWGVLSPGHGLPGSGWWRIRYMMAALTKSIVFGDKKEIEIFGPSFTRYTAAEIEQLSTAELEALGEEQARDYESRLWPLDYLNQQLHYYLERGA